MDSSITEENVPYKTSWRCWTKWRGQGGSQFLVVGRLNEDLLGVIGGEEVWGLKAEKVLRRDGYSDRARGWLERERERRRGRGEEGVLAGCQLSIRNGLQRRH